jgi:hypothetical protein
MIRFTDNGLNVSVSGPVIYLDTWAFIELAKKDPSRRKRFIDAVHSGMDILFSVTNAAEFSGPQGKSADALRAFLNDIGLHWFPARLDATKVIKLEASGVSPESACIDEEFFKSHVADQIRVQMSAGKIIKVSEKLLQLGPMLDRLEPQRESISRTSADFDSFLRSKFSEIHARCKREPTLLDQKFPLIPFNSRWPANFVYSNLLRGMVGEANSLKKGDGMDFFHAVIACAFSSFAALDTQWKRRIARLPPNPLARIYSPQELDQMVSDIEWSSENRTAR